MLGRFFTRKDDSSELVSSTLLNEETFYPALMKDLDKCGSELIIESPFITNRRLGQLLPVLQKLKQHKVRIIINTRDPHEHDEERRRVEAHQAVAKLQRAGIHVLYTGGHHRKLVILDRSVLYEGSLNVLSQNNSCEIMRRIESVSQSWQMVNYIGLDKYL